MVQKLWESNDRKNTCIYVTIKCRNKTKFRVVAADYKKANSKYADRNIEVLGERTIYLSFPVSPKVLVLTVVNSANPADKDFEVEFKEGNIKSSSLWMDSDTRSFVQMAIIFSQICGFTPAGRDPKHYKSSDGIYNIKFYDVIRDTKTGNPMTTPARIGHTTGTIEVSKNRFDKYTIPMRIIILLHEFSHKYRNPRMGLAIENETGADINALYIYLGLGFSKVDAIQVFANVFLKAQTPGNIQRMRIIMDYIKKFEEDNGFF